MKKKLCLLWAALLLLSLAAGCGRSGGSSAASSGSGSAGGSSAGSELRLETLNVELTNTGSNTAELAAALREFPDALKTALAKSEVVVDSVRVTVGTSTSATCAALSGSGVDVAFLPTEDFTRYGEGLSGILGNGKGTPGGRVQICAASTERGKALAAAVKDGKTLAWDELNKANWGVVKARAAGNEGDSVPLAAAVSLWLSDRYEGNTVSDLGHAATYGSYDELARAVEDGKVDAFPLPVEQLPELASVLANSPVLWTSEALFTWAAAVKSDSADLLDRRFSAALADAVETLCKEDPERAKAFGAAHFLAVNDGELDATRRLWTLNG